MAGIVKVFVFAFAFGFSLVVFLFLLLLLFFPFLCRGFIWGFYMYSLGAAISSVTDGAR